MNCKSMKIGLGLIVAIFLIAILSVSAPLAESKPITLRHADLSPLSKTHPCTSAIKRYGDEIDKRTGGKVKFEYYWSEGLAKAMDIPDAIRTGVTDTGRIVTVYYPAKFPAWTVVDVAGILDPYAVAMAMWELYDKEPAFKNDLDRFNAHPLMMMPLGETILHFRHPVTNLEGLKGLKLRALGSEADFIKQFGGVPVPIPHSELYTALRRGTVDGGIGFPFAAVSYGYAEVSTHWLRGIPGNFSLLLLINKDSWSKIPADIQKIMMEVGRESVKSYADSINKIDNNIYVKQKEKGTVINTLSEKDRQAWMDVHKPLHEKWKKDLAKKGISGEKILGLYYELVKKYGAKF